MALTEQEIRASYPFPVYNYRVEIGTTAVAFSEVSGLSISYGTTVYKESPTEPGAPGPRKRIMPAQIKDPTVTLKKGLVPSVSIKDLYQWIGRTSTNQIEKRDVYVHLCDEKGATVISWKIVNAFPTKVDAPSFSASSDDAAIESMELIADFITVEVA